MTRRWGGRGGRLSPGAGMPARAGKRTRSLSFPAAIDTWDALRAVSLRRATAAFRQGTREPRFNRKELHR